MIPYPLRWWYRWAGRRTKVMSGQNILLGPCELIIRDDLLAFYGENQWCYEWATQFEGDDPPVFGRPEPDDPWEPQGHDALRAPDPRLSLRGGHVPLPYGAAASWLGASALEKIIEQIPPMAINPWKWGGSVRFYAKGGAFMYTMPNGEIDGEEGYSVWIGAKTEHPLGFLKPYIDEGWEYVAV